jgi:hypothetical protein
MRVMEWVNAKYLNEIAQHTRVAMWWAKEKLSSTITKAIEQCDAWE